MENPSNALAGTIPATGALDRAPFKAWTMGKSFPTSDSRPDNLEELGSTSQALSEGQPDKSPMPAGLTGTCTLRVKPDRRRVQIPMPADLDRRRS
jgi:hypothetical protein